MTDYTTTATETPADGAGNYTATTTKAKHQRSAPQKVAATSILAFYQERAKGTFTGIENNILQSLGKGKPMTRRQLANDAGKDASSLCAALSDLQKKGLVRVAYDDKCPITGKLVSWFALSQTPLVESLAKPIERESTAAAVRVS